MVYLWRNSSSSAASSSDLMSISSPVSSSPSSSSSLAPDIEPSPSSPSPSSSSSTFSSLKSSFALSPSSISQSPSLDRVSTLAKNHSLAMSSPAVLSATASSSIRYHPGLLSKSRKGQVLLHTASHHHHNVNSPGSEHLMNITFNRRARSTNRNDVSINNSNTSSNNNSSNNYGQNYYSNNINNSHNNNSNINISNMSIGNSNNAGSFANDPTYNSNAISSGSNSGNNNSSNSQSNSINVNQLGSNQGVGVGGTGGGGGQGYGQGGGVVGAGRSKSNTHHSRSPTGVLLPDKLVEYSRRKQETDRRKVAERELVHLNLKIDKLLSKMGEQAEGEAQGKLKIDDECVVCLAAPATMQTFPCGHKVVCRKCLIKTIQVAVSQRCLPLRCVICRDRILKLHHTLPGQTADDTTGMTLPAASSPHPNPSHTFLSPSSSQSFDRTVPCTRAHASSSPSRLFSLITSSRPASTSPRHTNTRNSPAKSGNGSSASPVHIEKMCPPTVSFVNLPVDNDLPKHTPSNLEAFVHSHNDALKLRNSEDLRKAEVTTESKSSDKARSQALISNQKRQETPCLGFMSCTQSVKIHPETQPQMCAFLGSAESMTTASDTNGRQSSSHKTSKANKFIAKFLPRSSRRKSKLHRND